MRKIAVLPLPEDLVGNLVDVSTAHYSHSGQSTSVIDLKGVVAKIRGALVEVKERCATEVIFDSSKAREKQKQCINLMKNDNIDNETLCKSLSLGYFEVVETLDTSVRSGTVASDTCVGSAG
ncbi:hypothetical protein GBA52_026131 [Prunus armeniaca]|nr:hypothetical protein GBA52_026131 [Prunus armeniaca]